MHVETLWMYYLIPIGVMLGIVACNHVAIYLRESRRERAEISRLRVALVSELQALQDIYRLNIGLIERNAGYLVSSRAPIAIYKSNMSRILLLDGPSIERLVSLLACNEAIEAMLSARSNGRASLSYKLTADADLDQLKQLYAVGVDHIAWTCGVLGQIKLNERLEQASPRFTASLLPPSTDQ